MTLLVVDIGEIVVCNLVPTHPAALEQMSGPHTGVKAITLHGAAPLTLLLTCFWLRCLMFFCYLTCKVLQALRWLCKTHPPIVFFGDFLGGKGAKVFIKQVN